MKKVLQLKKLDNYEELKSTAIKKKKIFNLTIPVITATGESESSHITQSINYTKDMVNQMYIATKQNKCGKNSFWYRDASSLA